MKKKLISLLFLLGLVLVISPMVLSCSDKDEPAVEPDVPVTPDVPLPPVPTPIRWVENEVDGGERGVGIKVTKLPTTLCLNVPREIRCNLIVWMFILYVVCITTYLKVAVQVQVKKKSKI